MPARYPLVRTVAPVFLITMVVCVLAWGATPALALPPPPPNATTVQTRYGGKLTVDPAQFHIYDIPADRFESITGFPPELQAPQPMLGMKTAQAPAATGRVLTVLIEWENHGADQARHPRARYDSLLYSNHAYQTGSTRDYYEEVSYGAFVVTGGVTDWVLLLSMYDGWYDIYEIVDAIDPYVNFADYDADNDGYVDAFWIIHAGPGQEETHDLNDIWSHAYRGVYVEAGDGVALDRWSVQPEQHMGGEIISIRVFCHEYGHIVGMPDLYDYDGKLDTVTYFTPNDENDHPLVDWDVMGYGGYNIMSYGNRSCPSHFCGWSRAFLGWTTPTIPTCLEGDYTLYNIEEHATGSLLKVPINSSGSEYFLLEYRNPRHSGMFDHLNSDFSAYCPWFTPGRDTLDAGLLVTHIDETMVPNDGHPRYAVRVVDAGYDPAHPWDGTEFTEWWYPYEFRVGALYSPDDPGQTVLSPTTAPSSDGYDGPSGITVSVLSQNNDYMTIHISRPLAPVCDPVEPVTLEEGETRNVTITAVDPNCTNASLTASALPAYAAFFDSGNGRGTLSLEPQTGDAGSGTATIIASDGTLADTVTVAITVTPPSCACPCLGDPFCDGTRCTVQDVVKTADVAFRGVDPIRDAWCPRERTDVDADGATAVQDVVKVVNVAFRGADPAAEFTDPCAP